MARKTGSPRKQQLFFPCKHCDMTFKKNADYVLHNKEEHGLEL